MVQVQELFTETLANFDPKQHLQPLSRLAQAAAPVFDWDVHGDFAILLDQAGEDGLPSAREKLRNSLPHGLTETELEVLSDDFARRVLPRATKAFDMQRGRGHENAWLTTVFYRFALKMVLADRAAERQLIELQRARVPETAVSEIEAREEADMLARVPAFLSGLSKAEQRALKLYFGVAEGREHSVAEIAADLGCSPYHAKAAVVMGLARIASQLRAQGPLTADEFHFVQMFFAEGNDLDDAARQLGWSAVQARRVLRDVRNKFSRLLRARTVLPTSNTNNPQFSQEG